MTACIEWTKYCLPSGHGQRWWNGRLWLAHRVAWTEVHGAIPDGLYVCHHCDNPPCVNVDHLFLGTQADNIADMMAKGRGWQPRALRGEANPKAKLTQVQADAIRSDGRVQRLIAADYGVGQQLISRIKTGKRWTETQA